MNINVIKIGIRNNLLYPFMFMILSNLLSIINIVFGKAINNEKIIFLFSLIMIMSTIITSSIFLLLENQANKNERKNKIMGIKLIPHKISNIN